MQQQRVPNYPRTLCASGLYCMQRSTPNVYRRGPRLEINPLFWQLWCTVAQIFSYTHLHTAEMYQCCKEAISWRLPSEGIPFFFGSYLDILGSSRGCPTGVVPSRRSSMFKSTFVVIMATKSEKLKRSAVCAA